MMQKYYRHKIENLINISGIVTIHYFELKSGFKSSGESHDFWEMVYADKNSLICTVEDKEILLKEGEAIFHKPNEFHIHATSPDESSNVIIISFECKSESIHFFEGKRIKLSPALVSCLYMIIDESKKTFDIPISDPNIKKMPLQDRPTLGGKQLMKSLLEILLINMMRESDESSSGSRSFVFRQEFNEDLTNKIIDYMKQNVYQNITIDDICKRFNYTRSYLFRRFKSIVGKPIMAYFSEMKINEAKKLLRDSNMSVAQISDRLSFDSPNYFSKVFKRTTSYTPLQYKKIYGTKKK